MKLKKHYFLDLFNVLLQVLDEGRLTDGKDGMLIFAMMILLTSNIGAEHCFHRL